jgi:hypothetical protein
VRIRNPFRRPIPPRRYWVVLTVQSGNHRATWRGTRVVHDFMIEQDLFDSVLFDLRTRDSEITDDFVILWWHVMTEDASL